MQEIKVTGIELKHTKQDPVHTGLNHYYFILSPLPSADWMQCFNNETPTFWVQRDVIFTGRYMEVICSEDELVRCAEGLKKVVEKANRSYEEAVKRWEAEQTREKQKQQALVDKTSELAKKLKFD